jgi:hypothetical protein
MKKLTRRRWSEYRRNTILGHRAPTRVCEGREKIQLGITRQRMRSPETITAFQNFFLRKKKWSGLDSTVSPRGMPAAGWLHIPFEFKDDAKWFAMRMWVEQQYPIAGTLSGGLKLPFFSKGLSRISFAHGTIDSCAS